MHCFPSQARTNNEIEHVIFLREFGLKQSHGASSVVFMKWTFSQSAVSSTALTPTEQKTELKKYKNKRGLLSSGLGYSPSPRPPSSVFTTGERSERLRCGWGRVRVPRLLLQTPYPITSHPPGPERSCGTPPNEEEEEERQEEDSVVK